MASIIRIKRSSVSGNPTTLAAGELAYSALTDNGANGGDRLYIGIGIENAGNAANHLVIGGTYFTDKLDHALGTLTANSAVLVDANKKVNEFYVDNLGIDGNTLSSTDTNGNINIVPNGAGAVQLKNPYIWQDSAYVTLTEYIQDVAGGGIVDSAEIDATYDDGAGTTSLDLKVTGVTAGSYGSGTAIPTFTVDTKGRLSAAGSVSVATNLSIAGDTGTDTVSLLTDTLTITGGEGIDTAVTDNTLTISAEDATTTNKGVASFEAANFNVTAGAVSAKSITLGSSTLSLGSTTTNLAGLGTLGATGAVTFGSTLSVTGESTLASATVSDLTSGRVVYAGTAGALQDSTNLTFNGTTLTANALAVTNNATVGGTLGVTGAATLSSTLGVIGAATLSSSLDVAGNFAINTNKFTVSATSGNTTVAGTMGITGNTTVGGTLGATGAATLGSTLSVANDLSVNTNKFNVTASSGNTSIAGTLGVAGAATLSSTLAVTSNATVGGTLAVTGTSSFNANVDMNSNNITNLAEPVNDADAATKYYVDNAVTGLSYKDAVNLHADSNIALTGSTSTLVIDSHAALDQTDDGTYRLLLTGQTDSSENGIYVYTDNGTSYTLVRADDADTYQELDGSSVFVQEGTVYANTGWVQTNHYLTSFTGQTWVQFSGAGAYTAGSGLTQSGTIFNVGAGNGITVGADDISLATTVAGAGLIYTDGVLDVVGTLNRISVTADAIDISSSYIGQASITTLGTITTGTWNGSIIQDAYIADNLTISGGAINSTPIGGTTAASGSFTTLAASSTLSVTGSATLGSSLSVSGEATLASATVSDLTSGRVTYAGTDGALQDSSNLTFNGTTLTANAMAVTNNATVGGTLGVTGNVTVSANFTGSGNSVLSGFDIDGGTY